jgi:hypothetical protein
MQRMKGRKAGWIAMGMALAALCAAPPSLAAPENPVRPAATGEPTDVDADFTIHVGGLLFIQGSFSAMLDSDTYRLAANMGTAGTTRRFYPADYKLTSEGRLADESVKPRHYVSDSTSRDSARVVTMTYGKDGMPRLSAVPPYDPGDLGDVMPSLQQGTQDPVSAFLMPVAASENPCKRTIPVFDGKRRYDLKLAYEGTKEMTPRGLGKPVDAIVCTIRYVAIAPVEKRKFTDMLRRNDDMKVWLAPFDGGRVYMPVRFQLRTPLGGAVMELTSIRERTAARDTGTKTAMK